MKLINKMAVTYVVLHYLATADTIECAESIIDSVLPTSAVEVKIVIVDNGSPDESYKILQSRFADVENVYIIKSEHNLGFAKGNNLGFQYAKKKLKSDFIVLLNNDTIIIQNDFTEKIVRKYEEKKYFVLGPDIITADGYHQNPGSKQTWGLNELRIFRLKKRIRLLLTYLNLDTAVSKAIKNLKTIYRKDTVKGDVENTILHGACLIFSPEFVTRFDGLYPGTFLYMEEDILKLYSDYYGFLMLYSSELQIFHKEDAATNMIQISDNKKARRKYKYLIESSIEYSNLKRKMQKTSSETLR